MPDDWSWFWAGQSGRDNLLRDEIEGLQSTAYAASQQSARLSSQLRTLQGSIETRLQALSTAFDAYVELGDVREQLAGYPGTSAVRRQSLRALAVLEQGGVPQPLPADEVGYWLVGATNEVVALAGGTSVPARDAAAGPGTEHETFVVAALGWLGHGERVAHRVAPLLLVDGALAAPQVVLWRAVVHGCIGDAVAEVHDVWQPDLDLDAPSWDRFATAAASGGGPAATLRWVQALVDGRWAPSAPGDGSSAGPGATPPSRDREALRRLVEALVGAGLGEERALLERARVLRARIEEPGSPEPDVAAEPPRTPTTELVQEAILDPGVSPAARAELLAWVRPGLDAAVAGIAADVAGQELSPRQVHTELGALRVTGAGVDEARLAELEARTVQRFATSRTRVVVPLAVGGAALLVGLVLLGTDLSGLGVTLVLVAVVLAGLAVRGVLRARSARRELAEVRARNRRRFDEARASALADEAADRATKAEVAALARAITGEPARRTAAATPTRA